MTDEELELKAEEWVIDCVCKDCSKYEKCKSKEHCTCKECSKEKWQKGAEFGYNKTNEWHYNGIPHDNKPYLCKVKHPTNYDVSEYEILFFDDKDMTWFRWLTLWSGEEGNETARINRKVLAWTEIVPPKESE